MPPVPQEVPEKQMNIPLVAGAWAVLIALIAVGFFFRSSIADFASGIMGGGKGNAERALQLIEEGDFNAAAMEARKAYDSASNEEEKQLARSALEVANFRGGGEQERLEAIRLTKETYTLLKGNAYRQSLEVNELLGYFNTAYEQSVFDEIFKGEPFEKFLVPGDKSLSIRKLAEHSLALWPSTEAEFRIGAWHADQILYGSGGKKLTKAERQDHANEILKVIASADALISEQKARVKDQPFGYMVEPRYFFWKTYLYGIVARVYPKYIDDARKSLDGLVASYDSSRDQLGNKRPLIAARLPSGYFTYATSLYRVKGEAVLPEVRANLDALVDLIGENPAVHTGSFLATVRTGAASPELWDRNYKSYVDLAKVHPPFKAFLEKYGWKFEN